MASVPHLSRRLLSVDRRLARAFGRPRRPRRDPLDTLVETVLSQHTSDLNSGRAVIDGGAPGVGQSGGRVTGHFTVPQKSRR